MHRHATRFGAALILCAVLVSACGGRDGSGGMQGPAGADLSGFRTGVITVDATDFFVWLAETTPQRQQGLMEATPEQLAPLSSGTPRGMLFVFPSAQVLSFWMQDTYVPLDLAYVREDGTIAEIHMLQPLDTTSVPSGEAVRYALEVNAGDLAAHGIGVGSTLALPLP